MRRPTPTSDSTGPHWPAKLANANVKAPDRTGWVMNLHGSHRPSSNYEGGSCLQVSNIYCKEDCFTRVRHLQPRDQLWLSWWSRCNNYYTDIDNQLRHISLAPVASPLMALNPHGHSHTSLTCEKEQLDILLPALPTLSVSSGRFLSRLTAHKPKLKEKTTYKG